MSQKTPGFRIEEGKLLMDTGKAVSFKYPVYKAIGFDDVVVVMLLIQSGGRFNENVFGVSREGELIWQVPEKGHVYESSPYTNIGRDGDKVLLANFDGLQLTVDPPTGKILDERRGR
jgi:hypothetical protein